VHHWPCCGELICTAPSHSPLGVTAFGRLLLLLQIGNIFSGLFLSLRNTSSVAAAGLTTIRTPPPAAFTPQIPSNGSTLRVAAAGPAAAAAAGPQTSGGVRMRYGIARRRSWSEEPYLQDKLTAGATAVKVGGCGSGGGWG